MTPAELNALQTRWTLALTVIILVPLIAIDMQVEPPKDASEFWQIVVAGTGLAGMPLLCVLWLITGFVIRRKRS